MSAIRRVVFCAMAPEATSNRRVRRYGVLAAGTALAAGGLTYVGLADPHSTGSLFPACPFRALTGWYCPACGGLRMTHDILHGQLAAAAVDNVFLLVGLPVLAAWLVVRWRKGHRLMPPLVLIAMLAAAITWAVVRNLPGFPLVPTVIPG